MPTRREAGAGRKACSPAVADVADRDLFFGARNGHQRRLARGSSSCGASGPAAAAAPAASTAPAAAPGSPAAIAAAETTP